MKVAIVGAGTCGLYLAIKLSKMGHQVTVFEKNEKISNKICSGLFSKRILDFIPESKNLIQGEIKFVFIRFPKKNVMVEFSKPLFLMSHSELDKLLADLALANNVKIILNHKVSKISDDFNFLPKIENEEFDRIIGCDGAESFVRKHLKEKDPYLRLGIHGFTDKIPSKNFLTTFPCKNGFLWEIPQKSKVEYGIIADINMAYKIFTNFLKKNKIIIKNVKARIIPQGIVIPKNKKITLCGDAAGLTKPWSGGGVIWALTAANILLKTFPNFEDYRRKTKKFFKIKILISKIAIKIVYFLGFKIPWLLPKKNKIESDFLF